MGKRAKDYDLGHYTAEGADGEQHRAVPRTDEETDSSTDVKVQAALRRYARNFAIGFGILAFATAYVASDVSQTGCEGRQNTASTLAGIINRLDDANKASFNKGKITYAERQAAHAVYAGESQRLEIPKCNSVLPF